MPKFGTFNFVNLTEVGHAGLAMKIASSPHDTAALTQLPEMPWKETLRDLKRVEIVRMCVIFREQLASETMLAVSEHPDGADPKSVRKVRFAAQSWGIIEATGNPALPLAREFADVLPDEVPPIPPAD